MLGNGVKDRGVKQRLRLGNEKTLNDRTLYNALRRTLELEAVKIAVAFFGRPRKMREWTLFRSRPLLNERRGVTGTSPRKRRK
jgi:hypothetical protein